MSQALTTSASGLGGASTQSPSVVSTYSVKLQRNNSQTFAYLTSFFVIARGVDLNRYISKDLEQLYLVKRIVLAFCGKLILLKGSF